MADNEEEHLVSNVLTMIRIRLGTLENELRTAVAIHDHYDDHGSKRQAAMQSMTALIDFLDSLDDFHRQQLSKPLWTLFLALEAVDNGKRSPLLEPARQGGRPADTDFEAGYKGIASAAMTIMMNNGVRQDEAAKKVAREMARHGYRLPGGKEPSAATVRRWRDECIGHHGGTVMGERYDATLKIAQDQGKTDCAAALRFAALAGQRDRGLVSGNFLRNLENPPS